MTERHGWFFFFDRYAFLALFALPIIFGLETYYQNRYGEPDSLYIGGFWSIVYGLIWLIRFIQRRQGPKKFIAWIKAHGESVNENICFSDDAFEVAIDNYFSASYAWVSLTSFKDAKHYFVITIAGIRFIIRKNHFTEDEIDSIKALLRSRIQTKSHL